MARDAGLQVLAARTSLSDSARASTDDAAAGPLVLVADRARGVLIGVSALGPGADNWIGEAVLAIRAEVALLVLVDVVRPFPTVGGACEKSLRELAGQMS